MNTHSDTTCKYFRVPDLKLHTCINGLLHVCTHTVHTGSVRSSLSPYTCTCIDSVKETTQWEVTTPEDSYLFTQEMPKAGLEPTTYCISTHVYTEPTQQHSTYTLYHIYTLDCTYIIHTCMHAYSTDDGQFTEPMLTCSPVLILCFRRYIVLYWLNLIPLYRICMEPGHTHTEPGHKYMESGHKHMEPGHTCSERVRNVCTQCRQY